MYNVFSDDVFILYECFAYIIWSIIYTTAGGFNIDAWVGGIVIVFDTLWFGEWVVEKEEEVVSFFGFIVEFAVFFADVNDDYIGGVFGAVNIDDDDMGIGTCYLYDGVFLWFVDGILEFGVLPS